MEKISISLGANVSDPRLEAILQSWAESEGAQITIRRRLGSGQIGMHWHIGGRSLGMGTVEVNLYPKDRRLEIMVHDNRRGTWAGRAYQDLAQLLRSRLAHTR